jgi:hypothetical protein
MRRPVTYLVIFLLAAFRASAEGQDTLPAELSEKSKEGHGKPKSVRLGLSLGLRVITDFRAARARQISISATDTVLQVNGLDIADLNLSGVFVAFPSQGKRERWATTNGDSSAVSWKPTFWSRLGFLANVNITQITPQNASLFNKSVEGGIGFAYKIGRSDDFAIAVTYERVFSRRLRNPQLEGSKLIVGSETLTSLSLADDRFFMDDPLSALSFRFVYLF